ncbi:hypothetical protein [Chroococcidiopsis sp. CCNUC1]|uniref:hypothetical protein n=1 Tax=Chroococcidiopsis sp. CCNUC1 TaxID=2653189 RepID=UPI0020210454|nr:hypothetical protein [Chroococcidiopsis sp. CCNUC1]URD53614.1 hypothetical protein M5J74_30050 [Chroococcidiopsis sp. CCNUC1]
MCRDFGYQSLHDFYSEPTGDRTYRRSHSIPLPEATQVSQACNSTQRNRGDRWREQNFYG